MPFVVVDLGAFAVAGLCFLAAVALTYIIKAIASALPNLSILGVGLDLAGIFRDAADDIVNWVVDKTKQFWGDLEGWVSAHAYLIDAAFGAVVQAIVTHADYIAHIVTSVVPNAIHAAEAQAGKELSAAVRGVEGDISAAVTKVEGIISGDVQTITSTIRAEGYGIADDISNAVTKGVASAENYTDRAIDTLRNYTDRAVADAEGVASRALADARQQIGAAIASVASTAATELGVAESTLEAQIANAARQASSALQSTAAALGGEIAGAERELQGEIGQAVGTLTGDISSEAQAFAGDLSNLQSVLQAAIAASIAGVVARVAKLEECSVGVCSDSPNNFSNLLNDALGLASLAGVGAFLAEAIDHPAAAETEFADTVQGLYSTGQSTFHTLLSL